MGSHESPGAELSNATHQGGWVVIVAAIGLAILLVCLAIRVYVRSSTSVVAGAPDYVFAIASLFAIAHSGLVFWEVSRGLGTAIRLVSPANVQTLQKAFFASNVLYLVAVYLAKCCFCLVYLALTPAPGHNRATYSVLGFATAWVFASILAIGVDCELNPPWSDLASHCTDLFVRWQIITAFDIIIEIALLGLAIYLVSGLQTPLTRKIAVTIVFGVRIIVILPAVFRLHELNHQIRSSDPTFTAAPTVIWATVEVYCSVIACISYSFKTFSTAVSTNYGGVGIQAEVYDMANNRTRQGSALDGERRSSVATGASGHVLISDESPQSSDPERLQASSKKPG